jgi:hypothetical protein
MSKDITSLELNTVNAEVATNDELVTLDNLSLALVGGGEAPVLA